MQRFGKKPDVESVLFMIGIQELGLPYAADAAITRQLLAFSRKQVMQPQLLDLPDVIAGVVPMLSRLIGEDCAARNDPLLPPLLRPAPPFADQPLLAAARLAGHQQHIDVVAMHAFPGMWFPEHPNWDWGAHWTGWARTFMMRSRPTTPVSTLIARPCCLPHVRTLQAHSCTCS